jgi:peptide methionine sulfoxide reductase MsrA
MEYKIPINSIEYGPLELLNEDDENFFFQNIVENSKQKEEEKEKEKLGEKIQKSKNNFFISEETHNNFLIGYNLLREFLSDIHYNTIDIMLAIKLISTYYNHEEFIQNYL